MEQIIERHFIGTAVQEAVKNKSIKALEPYLTEDRNFKWINRCLKAMTGFGNHDEVLKTLFILLILKKYFPNIIDELLFKSIQYSAWRFTEHNQAYIENTPYKLK